MRFFVSRHVSESSPDHVRALAGRCVASVRAVYPTARVTVVEDRVAANLSFAPPDARVRVVANPFPGSGEMGTVYTALHSDLNPDREREEASVVMHDSMVLLAPITSDPGPLGVRALWDFRRYHFHHLPEVLAILAKLASRPGSDAQYDTRLQMACHARYSRVLEMVSLYTRPIIGGAPWSGCFGMGLLATRRGLESLNNVFGILEEPILREIDTREKRQAMERVVGLAMVAGAGEHLRDPVCGEIFAHPDPWKTESASMSLAEMKAFVASKGYRAPLAKSWVGR